MSFASYSFDNKTAWYGIALSCFYIASRVTHKQEGHDGPEIAHLYIGPWAKANFKTGAFI
jgi:hypothetical protein